MIKAINLEKRLESLKAQAEQGKTQKAKAEATLEQLNKQKEQIIAELAELGVSPENLGAEIGKLETEIIDDIKAAESLLE